MKSTLDNRFRLWDGPTRLFHWLLAVSVVAAIITGQIGGNWIDWHGRLGLWILGLLLFRLVWGGWSVRPTPAGASSGQLRRRSAPISVASGRGWDIIRWGRYR